MAINQLLQDVKHVFNPVLTAEDKSVLKVFAQVASTVTTKGSNTKTFSAAIARGRWDSALESVAGLSKSSGLQDMQAFSAMLSMLYVPACFVDLFALGVVRKIGPDAVTTLRSATPRPALLLVWESWGQNQTREGLIRFVVAGAILESRNPLAFQFGLENEAERTRFERYQKVLQYIAENNKAYSDVMRLVSGEKWREANEIAAKHLLKIGIKGGQTVDDPPALADFLILALTPVGDPQIVAHAALKSGKKKK
jgi:hypothetical protein